MLASALLRFPRIYSLFGLLVGGDGRKRFVAAHVRPFPGQRILDIGCGPADVLDALPDDVHYVGFDESAYYIQAARRRFGNRAEFRCARASPELVGQFHGFDVVLALGVLHHLNDAECGTLLRIAGAALREGGRLVTLDGCFAKGQGLAARYLLSKDRGKHVRTQAAYVAIARTIFSDVQSTIYNDLVRVPYTHLVMECKP